VAVGAVAGGLLLWNGSRLRNEALNSSQQRAADLNDGIRTRNVAATVAFAIAGAALATGIVTWILAGHEPPSPPNSSSPQIDVGLGQLQLSDRF